LSPFGADCKKGWERWMMLDGPLADYDTWLSDGYCHAWHR
jgi:hypothetical protein